MSEKKNKHFISLTTHGGASTIFDLDLTEEEYNLINRISALSFDAASIEAPVLVISKPMPALETEIEEVRLNTNAIPIIKQDPESV